MATTINADTSVGGAVVTGDASGVLGLQAAGSTQVTINGSGVTLANPLPVGSGGTGATSLSGITAGSATNLAGGSNGTIPYQSASGTTQMLAVGTSGQYLKSNGASAPTWASVSAGFTLATPIATTSGTSIDFTGIPAGVKQINVSFRGVGTSGSSSKILRIGDSGGVQTTGYQSGSARISGSTVSSDATTDGFIIRANASSDRLNGSIILTLLNSSTFTFVAQGCFGSDADGFTRLMGGSTSLSAVLDRVSITTQNGVDTFTTGEINISYI